MLEHPLLGDYTYNKFGAVGFAICHSGVLPMVENGRIAINAIGREANAGLVIDDSPPEGLPRRRFALGAAPMSQLEFMIPREKGLAPVEFFVRGPFIGRVDHVIGRGGEDYLGQGSTSQDFADCSLQLSADTSGILFDFQGTLSRQGFLDDVVLSLYQPAYAVRFFMTWQVARFFLQPNTLSLLYHNHILREEDSSPT